MQVRPDLKIAVMKQYRTERPTVLRNASLENLAKGDRNLITKNLAEDIFKTVIGELDGSYDNGSSEVAQHSGRVDV